MTDMEKTRISVAEFRKARNWDQIQELISGEIVADPPTDLHQSFVGNTYFFLRQTVESGNVRMAPSEVNFDGFNLVTPDVFWVSGENDHCSLFENDWWVGAPDLIVEVLAPSTVRKDRVIKFLLYEKYRVREYWMINPETFSIELWYLENNILIYQGVCGQKSGFGSRALKTMVYADRLFNRS